MKTEFITLSPFGAFALLICGLFLGLVIGARDVNAAIFGVLLLAVVRQDARESFASGSYQRGWFVWHRKGSVSDGEETNVVPFKGPAA